LKEGHWMLTSLHPTHAEDISARLQQAAQSGLLVMIPGAREARAGPPIVQAADAVEVSVTSRAAPPGDDRERVERAREGGGAPSERTVGSQKSILARMWRYLLYPAGTIAVSGPSLPRQR
jgi:hypothetical protein